MLRRAQLKPPVAQLNPHLTCVLCNGYFIDATTIIECLHSFCKSCIVKYLEANKFCPVCEVQVHKTKPLLNVRPDKTLQDLVYKVVPGLFQREMRLRRNYYDKHPEQSAKNPSDGGEESEETCFIYSSDETICLSLEYAPPPKKEGEESTEEEKQKVESSRRYLRCPAAVTVDLLKRLIRGKYGLSDSHAVDFLYEDAYLCDEYSLVDLAYIYDWRRKGPMRLRYRIYQYIATTSNISQPVVPLPLKNGIKDTEEKQVPVKEDKPVQETITATPEKKEELTKPSQTNGPAISTDVKGKDERDKMPPPSPVTSLANGISSKPPNTTANNAITITQSTSIKVPAKTWSPQKTALKRPASSEDASASPTKKAPRFFKRSLLPSTTPPPPQQPSTASVTESPVQEVAVNLSKPSPPLPSKPPKMDHKAVVPVSSSSSSIRPRSTTPSSTGHPYHPSWMRSGGFTPPPPPPPNQIRSTSMIPSFPPRHFISGFYHPYLPSPMSFPAPLPPPPPEPKSSTKTSSVTSSTAISSSISSSPRFPTPTFSLSGYPGAGAAGLSPLLAGLSPRDLVGSFYNSYAAAAAAAAAAAQQQRPFFTPGGFHSSLPPTVVTSGAHHHHSSSKAKSSSSPSGSLRPLIPRKHPVAPPPALAPLRTTAPPAIREPPKLIPIEEATKEGTVEKEIKKSASPAPTVVVESILPPLEKPKSPEPSPTKPESESKDPEPSPEKSNSVVESDSTTTETKPVENGTVEKEKSPSPEPVTPADVNGSTDSSSTTAKPDKEESIVAETTEVAAEPKISEEKPADVKEPVEEECSKSEVEATNQ